MTVLTGNEAPEVEGAGFTTEGEPALTYLVLYLNRAKSEFGDRLVRQALNHAIDRQALVDAVLFGAGVPTVQPFPEGYFAHNADYPADYYAFDPERARELLAEAGLPDGFEFDMLVPTSDLANRLAEALMQMLGEVGITPERRARRPGPPPRTSTTPGRRPTRWWPSGVVAPTRR